MHLRFLRLLDDVRSSYWFIPSLMAVVALILGATMIYVDAAIGSGWLDGLSWYQSNKPDGAQQVLSTIAGSAITVAGVVFSITIVSVSYAASQYGPRVLTNFMGDRGNQVTLGTFIATYLYCLVVLRTIRGGDENAFVPDLAVIMALVLALCSIGVLIYFIHHVPRSIHVNTVIAGIGRQFLDSLEWRFPDYIGREAEPPREPDRLRAESHPAAGDREVPRPPDAAAILSRVTGYIEAMDVDHLVTLAGEADIVFELRYQPGDFIHDGRALMHGWPCERIGDDLIKRARACIAVSSRRTPLQDIRFLADELVEIGARALSPGVNDPFTAITCLDWLGAALSELACRKEPSPLRADEDGTLRIVALPLGFGDFVERSLGGFRQYLAGDRIACLHALAMIREVARNCPDPKQIEPLRREAQALGALAEAKLEDALMDKVRQEVRGLLDELDTLRHDLGSDTALAGQARTPGP